MTRCVVLAGTPVEQCVANNEARVHRQEEHGDKTETNESTATTIPTETTEHYPPEILQNLIFQYQGPSTHSRWDKLLFIVSWADAEPPVADIWSALTDIPYIPYPSVSETDNKPSTLASSSAATHIPSTTSSTAAGSKAGSLTTSTWTITPRVKIQPHQATNINILIRPLRHG
ncbi:putative RNA polymerase II Elongator complex associated protein Kti12 [Aspergillus melleus]|uniref:putative RNA polymerase II Elongator complex associated protein Kti12 n=1 Tax=Aspergillus melleus TaxID=138277 RepID=UPI001E8E2ACA|nr:kti12, chromatin associated [Aspergillus melleus]KAH8424316.1 kti12, chromatin associated [Aspergillus melleus]